MANVGELVEPIKKINRRLKDYFGSDVFTGKPIWRVSWSDDQLEWRHGTYEDYSENGTIYLRTVTETRYTKKYNWISHRYILEQLVLIPEVNWHDLPGEKKSYELIWNFSDKDGKYLPPKYEACKVIIDLVNFAKGRASGAKRYIDDIKDTETFMAAKAKRIAEYEEYLFGDQSSLQGTTRTGESIIVPRNYGD